MRTFEFEIRKLYEKTLFTTLSIATIKIIMMISFVITRINSMRNSPLWVRKVIVNQNRNNLIITERNRLRYRFKNNRFDILERLSSRKFSSFSSTNSDNHILGRLKNPFIIILSAISVFLFGLQTFGSELIVTNCYKAKKWFDRLFSSFFDCSSFF